MNKILIILMFFGTLLFAGCSSGVELISVDVKPTAYVGESLDIGLNLINELDIAKYYDFKIKSDGVNIKFSDRIDVGEYSVSKILKFDEIGSKKVQIQIYDKTELVLEKFVEVEISPILIDSIDAKERINHVEDLNLEIRLESIEDLKIPLTFEIEVNDKTYTESFTTDGENIFNYEIKSNFLDYEKNRIKVISKFKGKVLDSKEVIVFKVKPELKISFDVKQKTGNFYYLDNGTTESNTYKYGEVEFSIENVGEFDVEDLKYTIRTGKYKLVTNTISISSGDMFIPENEDFGNFEKFDGAYLPEISSNAKSNTVALGAIYSDGQSMYEDIFTEFYEKGYYVVAHESEAWTNFKEAMTSGITDEDKNIIGGLVISGLDKNSNLDNSYKYAFDLEIGISGTDFKVKETRDISLTIPNGIN